MQKFKSNFIDRHLLIPLAQNCSQSLTQLTMRKCIFEGSSKNNPLIDDNEYQCQCIGICQFDYILRFEKLQKLHIDSIQLCTDCLKAMVKRSSGITHLTLRNCKLDMVKFDTLLPYLSKSIRVLDFFNSTLPNDQQFIDTLAAIENLKSLDLGLLDPQQHLHRFEGLVKLIGDDKSRRLFTNLESLMLSGQKFTDVTTVVSFLEQLPCLSFLGLCATDGHLNSKFMDFKTRHARRITVIACYPDDIFLAGFKASPKTVPVLPGRYGYRTVFFSFFMISFLTFCALNNDNNTVNLSEK